MCPPRRSSIVVHRPFVSGGRRATVHRYGRAELLGTVHDDEELVVLVERAGVAVPASVLDDPRWIEWRGGPRTSSPAAGEVPSSPRWYGVCKSGPGPRRAGRSTAGAASSTRQGVGAAAVQERYSSYSALTAEAGFGGRGRPPQPQCRHLALSRPLSGVVVAQPQGQVPVLVVGEGVGDVGGAPVTGSRHHVPAPNGSDSGIVASVDSTRRLLACTYARSGGSGHMKATPPGRAQGRETFRSRTTGGARGR
ncbi:hypothetical protein SUDANB180_00148 [Streptomyces sp. enrichment culture]